MLAGNPNDPLRREKGQQDEEGPFRKSFTLVFVDIEVNCVPYANQQGQCTAAQYTPDAARRPIKRRATGICRMVGGCLGKMGKIEKAERKPNHGGGEVSRRYYRSIARPERLMKSRISSPGLMVTRPPGYVQVRRCAPITTYGIK